MASKSQRRKEEHKRKREEKKKQLRKRHEAAQRLLKTSMPDIPTGSHARHQARVAAQKPEAWSGEMPEDVGIFDDAVADTLSAELAGQARMVREAIRLACEMQGEEALQCVVSIPRSSPYSEWRLFVKGLVAWLSNDAAAAGESWRRLDIQRRAARIATSMMCSLATNLEQVSIKGEVETAASNGSVDWKGRLDEALLYHAKLLRRERFDRTAIRLAEAGARAPEESHDLRLGPRKLAWLSKFSAEFGGSDPELVAALQQVALHRAMSQEFTDIFQTAVGKFRGPAHDPNNLFLTCLFYWGFDDARSERLGNDCLEKYLKELSKNEALPKPLRDAIASTIHLEEAHGAIRPKVSGFGAMMFGFLEEDKPKIRKHFKASTKAYPGNRAAHKKYAEWIQTELDDDRLTQIQRKPLNVELCSVMQAWSKGLPDDTEPRLWLVDYLLEEERTEEVKPHVDWLAASRQDNPHVRAAPWKWCMLETMRLCRQKARCTKALSQLGEAEACWPAWLSKDWLPYLRAAISLRQGDVPAYEQQRAAIWEHNPQRRDSLADSCMMLGAAQRMRIPAADLKPLRVPVDQALKRLDKLTTDELLETVAFFWDLHRTSMQYPALRMHGKKIAEALLSRLKADPTRVTGNANDERIQAAILQCSEMRCFERFDQLRLTAWLMREPTALNPRFIAAKINAIFKSKSDYVVREFADDVDVLRDAARTEGDAYYRYWYASLATRMEETIASKSTSGFGSGFEQFARMAAEMQGFGDDDDDDDDDEFDDDEFDDHDGGEKGGQGFLF